MCKEVPRSDELAEHWASLVLAASLYWLRRQLVNGEIFIRQARITPEYWKKKPFGNLQLRCEHKNTYRSSNQYGSFLHCRRCGMRLEYVAVDGGGPVQARKGGNGSRRQSVVTRSSESVRPGRRQPTERGVETGVGYPAECSPAGAARGSASVSRSGVEQALMAMMVSQQERMQLLAAQLRCMADQQANNVTALARAMIRQQADNVTALTRAMSSLEQSMVVIAAKPREGPATDRKVAEEFYICSEGEQ